MRNQPPLTQLSTKPLQWVKIQRSSVSQTTWLGDYSIQGRSSLANTGRRWWSSMGWSYWQVATQTKKILINGIKETEEKEIRGRESILLQKKVVMGGSGRDWLEEHQGLRRRRITMRRQQQPASRYKLSFLVHWVPGAGASFCQNFFFIQAKLGFCGKAPVCSAWITQVKINSIN